ncbi:MAG: flagellar basal body rod protein FlgB [Polyangiaceae bacterium]
MSLGGLSWHAECFGPVVPNFFSGIVPLQSSLDYHLERHNVIASNVAHVDTPGYHPNDLARVIRGDFASVLNVMLERTNPQHLSARGEGSNSRTGRVFEDLTAGAGNDGNYVSMDRESAKLAANHLRYEVVSALTASELKGLAWAANDGKG